MDNLSKLKQLVGMVGKDPYEGMDVQSKKLAKLEQLLGMLDESITKEEFVGYLEKILELIKSIKERNLKAIDDLEVTYKALLERVTKGHDKNLQDLKDSVKGVGDKMTTNFEILKDELKFDLEKKKAEIKDNIDNYAEELDRKVANIKIPEPPKPDTPEVVRNKLEVLKGKERLNKSAIDGLEDMEKDLRGEIKKSGGGGKGITSWGLVNAVRYVDLSAQCDGSNKEFYVPSFRKAVLLTGTQFPLIYRPGTDYSLGNKKITLLDPVDAPQAGQSLIFLFIK